MYKSDVKCGGKILSLFTVKWKIVVSVDEFISMSDVCLKSMMCVEGRFTEMREKRRSLSPPAGCSGKRVRSNCRLLKSVCVVQGLFFTCSLPVNTI